MSQWQAGTAPDRFGSDRNGASVVHEIEAAELCSAFDPVGTPQDAENFAWLPVGLIYEKPACGSVSLI